MWRHGKYLQEIYIGGKRQVVIMCPRCGREKTIETSKLKRISKPVRVGCSCGFAFKVVFEKRACYRKWTRLSGNYSKVDQIGFPDPMTVFNISRGGLGFEAIGSGDTKEGDILKVEFTLDNDVRTIIRASIVVRTVKDRYIGGEFRNLEEHAKRTLGFYLMP